MSASFLREYLVRLPLPLAQLYSRAYNAKDPRGRHDNTFYLFEALIKLAAAPAIACYLDEVEHGSPRVPALDRQLAQLALPSLGQWLGILRELARHFGNRADAASHPLGHPWKQLDASRRDLPGVLALYQRIKNGPDGQPGGDESCSLLQLFDALVQYRNGVFGHGAGRFESFYTEQMGPLLFPAVNDVLADEVFDYLGPRGSRLVYLTEVRTLDEVHAEIGLREMIGLQGERLAPVTLGVEQASRLLPNRLAVFWPGRSVPLRLDPLLVYRESETAEEVLFLNRDRNGRQVEYLSYTTGRTERDKATAPALAALLSLAVNRTVRESDLDVLAEQSRGAAPSVEALLAEAMPIGQQQGDYEILAEIGRGGMGVVYLARQLSLGRLVALKMLPADLAGDEAALARFRREIRHLARCEHPNIVKVLSSGTLPDGRLYYAMEYVPGCDLEQVWRELSGSAADGSASSLDQSTWASAVLSASRKRRQETAAKRDKGEPQALPLPPPPELPDAGNDPGGYVRRVVQLVHDAALALEAVHGQQVIHRDVKPANLMLSPDGSRVVLMDFGLAKGQSLALTASKSGGFLGTLRYAAPEQLAAASLKIGPAVDVRGLGVVLWEVLTRRRLFGDVEDEKQLSQRIFEEDVPRLRNVDPTLDRDLEAIVARATERRSTDRIATAGKLAEYLQLYLDGKSLPIRPPSAAELLRRWMREHKGLVGSTAVALLLGGGGAFLWEQQRAQRQADLARQEGQTRQAVQSALVEVTRFQERARWEEARVTLNQAASRLIDGQPADLHQQLKQSGADLELVARCDAVNQKAAALVRQGLFFGRADEEIAAAFQQAGIGQFSDPPATVAERVRASAVRGALVAALDFWAICAREPDQRLWVLNVLRQADPDPWRDRARDAETWANTASLARLAREAPLEQWTPQLLVVVGARLHGVSEGQTLLQQAQRRFPDDFWINFALAFAIEDDRPEEALGYYRAALALRPTTPALLNSIGEVLYDLGRHEEALQAHSQAIALDANFGYARHNRGMALKELGRLKEAQAEFDRAVALGHQPAIQQSRRCEEMIACRTRLTAVLAGKDRPAEAAEYLALAVLCQQPSERRHAAAARFYAEAFAAKPLLAKELGANHRYNAACSATLAGFGQGVDAGMLDEAAKAKLRQQALDWLNDDLALWSTQLRSWFPATRTKAQEMLRHWRTDKDLLQVRYAGFLASVPAAEREAWVKLWGEVEARLEKR